jgi:hypothetical protein
MASKCVPMIHVPDVRATVEWYQGIGFTPTVTFDDGGDGLSFARLSFGTTEVMFSSGGRASNAERRDVDLYVYTEDVDGLHERLKDRVDVIEGPHDTFYGMREVIIRDLNRFWMTFGETSAGEILLAGARTGHAESVREALGRPGLSAAMLSAALGAARQGGDPNPEVIAMLEAAGAVAPFFVEPAALARHAGTYRSDEGMRAKVGLHDGRLLVIPEDAPAVWLLPFGAGAFTPIGLADAGVTFDIVDGATVGLTFTQGPMTVYLRRIGD